MLSFLEQLPIWEAGAITLKPFSLEEHMAERVGFEFALTLPHPIVEPASSVDRHHNGNAYVALTKLILSIWCLCISYFEIPALIKVILSKMCLDSLPIGD
jgi:hypothetical protein